MNTNERPTPETDEAFDAFDRKACGVAHLRHKMKQLERERDEARQQIQRMQEQIDTAVACVETVQRERDEARAEIKKLRKLLDDANRGAEWDAHINNSLAGKLNEAQKEIKAMREAIKDAHDALDDITTKLVGWHGLYENQVGKDDEEAFRKGDAALAKLQPYIQ